MKFLILACGRTGQHAIIRWIAEGLDGPVAIHHNCKNWWDRGELRANRVTGTGKRRKNPHIIKNIEDFYLPLWDNIKEFEKFDHIITIVRSPRNWLASSIAAQGWANDYLDAAPENYPPLPVSRIKAYKMYLEHCALMWPMKDVKVLDYDKWVDNLSYRKRIAKVLNISCVKKPDQCKFSSFKRPFNHTEDRSKLLGKKKQRRFKSLYDNFLKEMQESLWTK